MLAVRLLTFPRTPWEPEELRFPFAAMVAVSIVASVVTAVALARAFDDALGAVLFSLAAGVVVHAPMARMDALAWMFVAVAVWSCGLRVADSEGGAVTRNSQIATLFGALSGAVAACKPAFLLSALALLFAALFLVFRERRERVLAGIAFAAVALPFMVVPEDVSGVAGWNVVRFTLHPWGSKLVFVPLLAAVVAGIRPVMRAWNAKLEVLMWFALVHVATGVAAVKPADGVRWAAPSLMFTALVAAAGLRAMRIGWIGGAALCALSLWYAYPILRDRVTRPSVIVQALAAIPKDAAVLHDEATAFAGGMPYDAGVQRFLDHPRLLHVAAVRSHAPGARVFARGEHDAYGKLTTNVYGAVSLIPVPHPWFPMYGVGGVERGAAGESWRWLQKEAAIGVPAGRGPVTVTLRLPADAPLEANEVRVNGMPVRVRRGETVEAQVGAGKAVELRGSRAFPLGDGEVAVQLLGARR